jgi:hypothetical protein
MENQFKTLLNVRYTNIANVLSRGN